MATRSPFIAAVALGLGAIACNALFGETSQCNVDADCAGFGADQICGPEGTCIKRDATPGPVGGPDSGGKPPAEDAAVDSAIQAGPLAKIVVSPDTTTVQVGKTQTFSAVGIDTTGRQVSPAPTYTWTVAGGGTIDNAGKFTAGNTAGGPFTVTVTSGAISATAKVTVSVAPPVTVILGDANQLPNDDSGNMDMILAQKATLGQSATLKSLTFYVAQAAGNLRLGLYDASGPNGGPGAKKAETAEFAPVVGANKQDVVTPVLLTAGDYWLAYAPSDNNLHFYLSNDGDGMLAYAAQTYGALPATFPTTVTNENKHWTFTATLTK